MILDLKQKRVLRKTENCGVSFTSWKSDMSIKEVT